MIRVAQALTYFTHLLPPETPNAMHVSVIHFLIFQSPQTIHTSLPSRLPPQPRRRRIRRRLRPTPHRILHLI